MTHALGVADGPLHGLHTAEATADHRCPLLDAEVVGQPRLAVYPVFHGHYREVRAKGLAGRRVGAAGAGGTVAAAEVVQADDKELVGVDGFAGTDTAVPPARFTVIGAVITGSMVVAGQGVADQHGVARRGIQLAIGFEDQLVVGQAAPAGQRQRFCKVQHLRGYQANRVLGKGSRHRPCSQ